MYRLAVLCDSPLSAYSGQLLRIVPGTDGTNRMGWLGPYTCHPILLGKEVNRWSACLHRRDTTLIAAQGGKLRRKFTLRFGVESSVVQLDAPDVLSFFSPWRLLAPVGTAEAAPMLGCRPSAHRAATSAESGGLSASSPLPAGQHRGIFCRCRLCAHLRSQRRDTLHTSPVSSTPWRTPPSSTDFPPTHAPSPAGTFRTPLCPPRGSAFSQLFFVAYTVPLRV